MDTLSISKNAFSKRDEELSNGIRLRKMTKDEFEIFARSQVFISRNRVFQYLYPIISALNPFVDNTMNTCYVDESGRIGISVEFLHSFSEYERRGALIHEALHLANRHFLRADSLLGSPSLNERALISADMEINSLISQIEDFVKDGGSVKNETDYNCFALIEGCVYPENYGQPQMQTFEYYYNSIGEQDVKVPGKAGRGRKQASGKKSGSNGNDSAGNEIVPSGGCCSVSEGKKAEIDELGISRKSPVEIEEVLTRSKTILDEVLSSEKGVGSASMNMAVKLARELMNPPKADWRKILSRVSRRSMGRIEVKGSEYKTYRRVNRRNSSGSFILPGRKSFIPVIYFAIDTSGSMGKKDFMMVLSECEGILKSVGKGSPVKCFCIDTEMKEPVFVRTVKDINLTGGGGTDMAPAIAYANSVKSSEKPALLVIATDGYIPTESIIKEAEKARFQTIFAVTKKEAYKNLRESFKAHSKKITVIDVSEDK